MADVAEPQIRGEAYRDLAGTMEYLAGSDDTLGWPACYARLQAQLATAHGLLREACIGYENGALDPFADKRLRIVPIFQEWYKRAKGACGDE